MTTPYPSIANADNFRWETGVTPLGNVKTIVITLTCYLIVIFGLREWMRNRDAFVLKSIARVHNFILCTGSLAITATCLFEIGRFYFVEGYTVRDLFCDNVNGVTGAMTTGRLGVVAWAYYASKYYELLDTVLMVLKKKPLSFLHVYHHCVVMYLVYTWNVGNFSLQWWAIFMNTAVHVCMYYYYFVASLRKGYRPWWRQYITTFQLFQFATVFINIFVWVGMSLVNPRLGSTFPFLEFDSSECAGETWVVTFAQTVNVSFLFLFGQFYVSNYLAGKRAKAKARAEAKAGKEGKKQA